MATVDATPRYPRSLSAKLQNQIEQLIETSVAEVPEPNRTEMTLKIQTKVQDLVKTMLAEVSEMYREGLTTQVGLLTVENEKLTEQNEELRERANS